MAPPLLTVTSGDMPMKESAIRRILCPTDFSALSSSAFEHALFLAGSYGATLTVLHVIPDTMVPTSELAYMANPMLLDPALRGAIEADLSSLVACAHRLGVQAEREFREGKPAAEIVRVAWELPADLLVMGTHGRSGFQRWTLGSVAESVLRRAPCPVVTVPALAAQRGGPMLCKRILCATDFSPASEVAIGFAASLAEKSDASLLLVHVVDRPGEGPVRKDFECAARDRLRRALSPAMRDRRLPEEIVTVGKPAPEILRLAVERDASLIVMGVHGRSLLGLMAFGSVSHQVLREAACPVLTVRAPSGD